MLIPNKFFVRVSKACIKDGERKSTVSCPVALAIKRSPKLRNKLKYAYVRPDYISLQFADLSNRRYELSRSVTRFIDKFDAKGKDFVKPFTFIMRDGV